MSQLGASKQISDISDIILKLSLSGTVHKSYRFNEWDMVTIINQRLNSNKKNYYDFNYIG